MPCIWMLGRARVQALVTGGVRVGVRVRAREGCV